MSMEEMMINMPQDFVDAEGYLCCGKCGTRKQTAVNMPLFDGTGRTKRKLMGILCKCETEAREKEEALRKLREHRDKVYRLQSVCFTDAAMRNQTFANAELLDPDILRKAQLIVDHWDEFRHENAGFLFWGGVGNGKSYTAACIANALMEKEISVLMRNTGFFLNSSFEDRSELIRDIARYDLFILDDLGTERDTGFGHETVFNIIDARYNSKKPTIITTNLPLSAIQNPMDLANSRIYDRITEMCTPIQFKGASVRSELQKKKMDHIRRLLNGEE